MRFVDFAYDVTVGKVIIRTLPRLLSSRTVSILLRGMMAFLLQNLTSVSMSTSDYSCSYLTMCDTLNYTSSMEIMPEACPENITVVHKRSGKAFICEDSAWICECNCLFFTTDVYNNNSWGTEQKLAENIGIVCSTNRTISYNYSQAQRNKTEAHEPEILILKSNISKAGTDKSECHHYITSCGSDKPFNHSVLDLANEPQTNSSIKNVNASIGNEGKIIIADPSPLSGSMMALLVLIAVIVCVGVIMLLYRK